MKLSLFVSFGLFWKTVRRKKRILRVFQEWKIWEISVQRVPEKVVKKRLFQKAWFNYLPNSCLKYEDRQA